MMTIDNFIEVFPLAMKVDGYDDAIVGFEMDTGRLIYDRDKMVEIMVKEIKEDQEYDTKTPDQDAQEYLEYNVFNTYLGDFTPIYIEQLC